MSIDLAVSQQSQWVTFSIPLSVGTVPVVDAMNRTLVAKSTETWWELMRYDSTAEKYLTYGKDDEFGSHIEPGVGYIFRSDQSQRITVKAPNAQESADYSTALRAGWNLVGYPFTKGIPMSQCTVSIDGNSVQFVEATTNQWVRRYVYTMTNGDMLFEAADDEAYGRFEPYKAYWIKAGQACLLTFPNPDKPTQ